MRLDISSDLDKLIANVDAIQRDQIPFATAKALTRVAQIGQAKALYQIRSKLDRPTRWTQDSIFVKPATKRQLWSMIYVKDGFGGGIAQRQAAAGGIVPNYVEGPPQEYSQAYSLAHLFSGGKRQWKRFEVLLHQAGIMPTNMSAVPGVGCPLDAFGNIPRALIVQLLAYFSTFRTEGFTANMTAASRARFEKRAAKRAGVQGIAYFVVTNSSQAHGLKPGIWQRVMHGGHGRSFVRPIIIFVSGRPNYSRRFDLGAIAEDAKDEHFAVEFNEAMAEAIRTAR